MSRLVPLTIVVRTLGAVADALPPTLPYTLLLPVDEDDDFEVLAVAVAGERLEPVVFDCCVGALLEELVVPVPVPVPPVLELAAEKLEFWFNACTGTGAGATIVRAVAAGAGTDVGGAGTEIGAGC